MSVTLLQRMPPTFGRHQTFTIRHTWLKVAYDAVVAEPKFFARSDAHRELGVGKNMARSIRFWIQATGIAEERTEGMAPTPFGRLLLDEKGLDPYLEADASWWLLHWKLISPRSQIPSWWAAFHSFAGTNFTSDSMHEHVANQFDVVGMKAPESTLRRDIQALVRNYAGTTDKGREKADDRIDLPFASLGLIRPSRRGGYRFLSGPKPGLDPAIVTFAVLDFLAALDHLSDSVLVGTLALDGGGPGRAFKLTERDLTELLRDRMRTAAGLHVGDLNGASQLFLESDRETIALEALASCYQRHGLLANDIDATGCLLAANTQPRLDMGDTR